MKELEILLNTLIKMGWKPFGMEIHAEYIDRIVVESSTVHIIFKGDGEYIEGFRTLVSQESGLWQFCAENELLNIDKWATVVYRKGYSISDTDETIASDSDYQYRLLESALIPEKELAKFLVDNIKVE